MKRKSFVLRKCNKKITCLLNRKEYKAVTTCFSKNIYIQSMKKNILIQSMEKKLILQKFFLLCIVSFGSITIHPFIHLHHPPLLQLTFFMLQSTTLD